MELVFDCQDVRFHYVVYNFTNRLKQTSMLPDNFPVFNIDLDCDFQSSDNVFPTFPSNKIIPPLLLVQVSPDITAFSAQGRRKDNLDRYSTYINQKYSLFGVFDGHCDPQPVDFVQTHLFSKLQQHPLLLQKPQTALLETFEFIEKEVAKKYEKGCTALVVLRIKEMLHVANLGDSRLMGINSKDELQSYTTDHNLANKEQLMAVISKGAIVLKKGEQYRINGQLNLSRCFGDKHLKHCISSLPDILSFQVSKCRRWILATDGFTNAKNLQKRARILSLSQLQEQQTVYMDNATAIFLNL